MFPLIPSISLSYMLLSCISFYQLNFSGLVRKKGTSLNDADISIMYAILRNSVVPKPKNGWGKPPGENDMGLADDIERIHQCRNLICHTDASEIETTLFNKSVLDLSGVFVITPRFRGISIEFFIVWLFNEDRYNEKCFPGLKWINGSFLNVEY